jgi:hypothetical protein
MMTTLGRSLLHQKVCSAQRRSHDDTVVVATPRLCLLWTIELFFAQPQLCASTNNKTKATRMSYNPRMSIAPSTQQQNRGKKKDDESDAFMRLVS